MALPSLPATGTNWASWGSAVHDAVNAYLAGGGGGSAQNVVVAGSNLSTARPAVAGPVIWFATGDPVNADDTQDVTVYITDDGGLAPAGATDAQLRDRATHTGTQPASTITGLATVATTGAYTDLVGVGSFLPPHTVDPRNPSMSTPGASVAGRMDCCRIVAGGPLRISRIGINIGVSSGNICLSVWSNSGVGSAARPTTLLGTTGSVACPIAGPAYVSLTAPVDVVPGMWFGLSVDNGTATFTRTSGQFLLGLVEGFAVRMGSGGMPAPSTFTYTSGHGNAWLMVGLE